MSRGPGRLQRELLALLATDNRARQDCYGGRVRAANEWTTSDLCSAYSKAHPDWWFDDFSERGVRRSLDGLARLGLVEKRVIPNGVYNRVGSVTFWRQSKPKV